MALVLLLIAAVAVSILELRWHIRRNSSREDCVRRRSPIEIFASALLVAAAGLVIFFAFASGSSLATEWLTLFAIAALLVVLAVLSAWPRYYRDSRLGNWIYDTDYAWALGYGIVVVVFALLFLIEFVS